MQINAGKFEPIGRPAVTWPDVARLVFARLGVTRVGAAAGFLHLSVVALIAGLVLTGCGGGMEQGGVVQGPEIGVEDELAFTATDSTFVDPTYRLGPADEIELNFLFDHSLDTRIVVRPDGAINLPIIGDFTVAGRTPGDVCKLVSVAYARYYTNPQLSLNLTKFAPAQAYVLGEVKYPKSVVIRPGMTVLSAIADAGGHNELSNFSSTILIRRVSGTRAVARRLNLTAYLKGKKGVSSDLYLQDYDIIYVPKSLIGRLASVVDNVLDKLIVIPTLYLKGWEMFHQGRVYTRAVSAVAAGAAQDPAK